MVLLSVILGGIAIAIAIVLLVSPLTIDLFCSPQRMPGAPRSVGAPSTIVGFAGPAGRVAPVNRGPLPNNCGFWRGFGRGGGHGGHDGRPATTVTMVTR